MRLIDADKLMQMIPTEEYNARMVIANAPTVDAVEVVRCKDCKYYNAGFECLKEGYGIEYPQDWYCADGERREDVRSNDR